MDFNATADKIMKMRANFGAPESMKTLERVSVNDLKDKVITIDELCIVSTITKNKDTKEVVKTKDGKDVYTNYVYVAFDKEYYFSTKSQILLEQIEDIVGKKLKMDSKGEVKVKDLAGETVRISAKKVRYSDGKDYDNVIFANA